MRVCVTTKLEVLFFTFIFTVSIVLPYPKYNNTLDYCWTTACCCVAAPDEVWHENELVTLLAF